MKVTKINSITDDAKPAYPYLGIMKPGYATSGRKDVVVLFVAPKCGTVVDPGPGYPEHPFPPKAVAAPKKKMAPASTFNDTISDEGGITSPKPATETYDDQLILMGDGDDESTAQSQCEGSQTRHIVGKAYGLGFHATTWNEADFAVLPANYSINLVNS